MKIKFDIQSKYKETEIHLCDREKSQELTDIYEMLEKLLDTKIKVHKGQESGVVVPSQIVRIYSENKKGVHTDPGGLLRGEGADLHLGGATEGKRFRPDIQLGNCEYSTD